MLSECYDGDIENALEQMNDGDDCSEDHDCEEDEEDDYDSALGWDGSDVEIIILFDLF